MWYREFYPRSRPRAAKGGIKAQSKRGQFGTSWWAKRWIAVLESFQIGSRLARGRSYARNGQVLSIDITKGKVKSKVQGSRPQPYEVTIQLAVLSEADWDKLGQALTRQAVYVAKLLAGEMPPDIETIFQEADLSLFPRKLNDLKTSCSCPDYSNPCKHIAAVYYLLGEEFDRDPFLLFRLRGLSREELFEKLSSATPADPVAAAEDAPTPQEAPPSDPVTSDAKAFWAMGEVPADLFGDVSTAPVAAAWPKRLGSFPFWRGGERFLEALEPMYRNAATQGLTLFRGEQKSSASS